MPVTDKTLLATFTDGAANLAIHEDPIDASSNLQNHVNELELWMNQGQQQQINPNYFHHQTNSVLASNTKQQTNTYEN